jgi:hypothetical protein
LAFLVYVFLFLFCHITVGDKQTDRNDPEKRIGFPPFYQLKSSLYLDVSSCILCIAVYRERKSLYQLV